VVKTPRDMECLSEIGGQSVVTSFSQWSLFLLYPGTLSNLVLLINKILHRNFILCRSDH
jgi:hypothetical protein